MNDATRGETKEGHNALIIRQFLTPDDSVQVRLHQLLARAGSEVSRVSRERERERRGSYLDEVDFSEALERGRFDNIEDRDDVLVVKPAQEFDLAQGAQAEHGVVERGDLLDCDFGFGRRVDRRAHDTVCAFADDVDTGPAGQR